METNLYTHPNTATVAHGSQRLQPHTVPQYDNRTAALQKLELVRDQQPRLAGQHC
jgi:hypothetical protein